MHIIAHSFAQLHIIVSLALIVILLLISGFISGSETAIFSLTSADVDRIKQNKNKNRSKVNAVLNLLSNSDYTLATLLIINNLVNILVVILTSKVIGKTIEFTSAIWEFVFTTVVVTFLLLLFGEILPKVFASHNSTGVALFGGRAILFLRKITKPFAFLLVRSGSKLGELTTDAAHENLSLDELSEAIDITQTKSVEEKKMLNGVVSFADTVVEDIMCPRVNIVALDKKASFAEVKQIIISSGFSRIPVYDTSIDNVTGVLYVKDVFPYLKNEDSYDWTAFPRLPHFVSEHKRISELLDEFRAQHVHIAIVVDEYGTTIGLVSLEDILEEVVGEISDESDDDSQKSFEKIGENVYIFDAKTHIGDMEKILAVDEGLFDDIRGEAETVAGLMLEVKRHFLRKGESLVAHGITFTVVGADNHRVDKVKVEINGKAGN